MITWSVLRVSDTKGFVSADNAFVRDAYGLDVSTISLSSSCHVPFETAILPCLLRHCSSLLTYKAAAADKEPWLGVTDINGFMNTMFTFLPPSSILISTSPHARSQDFISSDDTFPSNPSQLLLSHCTPNDVHVHRETRECVSVRRFTGRFVSPPSSPLPSSPSSHPLPKPYANIHAQL